MPSTEHKAWEEPPIKLWCLRCFLFSLRKLPLYKSQIGSDIFKKMEKQDTITNSEPVISIKGLYKSFGELDILKDISLDVFKGENVAVLGRSGAGKSVLIKILVGL